MRGEETTASGKWYLKFDDFIILCSFHSSGEAEEVNMFSHVDKSLNGQWLFFLTKGLVCPLKDAVRKCASLSPFIICECDTDLKIYNVQKLLDDVIEHFGMLHKYKASYSKGLESAECLWKET